MKHYYVYASLIFAVNNVVHAFTSPFFVFRPIKQHLLVTKQQMTSFSTDGYFNSFPPVPEEFSERVVSSSVSGTEAYLNSLAQIADTWTAESFRTHLLEQEVMPLSLDETTTNSLSPESVGFMNEFPHFNPSFDNILTHKLMGKQNSFNTMSSPPSEPSLQAPSELDEFPVFPKATDLLNIESSTDQVIMGGPRSDDVAMAVSSLNFDDLLTTPLSEDGIHETINQIASSAASELPVDLINGDSAAMPLSPEVHVQETVNNVASVVQEQQNEIIENIATVTDRASATSPFSVAGDAFQKLTLGAQQQQAHLGDKISDMTASASKLFAAGDSPSSPFAWKAMIAHSSDAVSVATNKFGGLGSVQKGSLVMQSAARSPVNIIQGVADRPVSELGDSGAKLVTTLAQGSVSSLERVGSFLFQFLDSMVAKQSGAPVMELVHGAQASINKVIAGGVEAILSTANGVGDITIRQMVQGVISLVVLVMKVLFQLVSTLVAAAGGKGISAWIEDTNIVVEQSFIELGSKANELASDMSHKSLNEMLSMVDSFLHQSTAYMAESVGTVMHMNMGEAAGTMTAPLVGALVTESLSMGGAGF